MSFVAASTLCSDWSRSPAPCQSQKLTFGGHLYCAHSIRRTSTNHTGFIYALALKVCIRRNWVLQHVSLKLTHNVGRRAVHPIQLQLGLVIILTRKGSMGRPDVYGGEIWAWRPPRNVAFRWQRWLVLLDIPKVEDRRQGSRKRSGHNPSGCQLVTGQLHVLFLVLLSEVLPFWRWAVGICLGISCSRLVELLHPLMDAMSTASFLESTIMWKRTSQMGVLSWNS